MRNLFSSPLGASIAPIGNKKCMPAWLAPALAATAAGVGNVISGATQLINDANTNKTNYKIWQEQLAYAKEQYEKERLENRSLIDEERAYNDPSNERERFLRAGINPTLAKYGGASSLSSVGVGSTPSMSQPDAPRISPSDYSFIARSAESSASAFMDYNLRSENQEAQISALKQRVNRDTIESMAKIQNLKVDEQYKRDMITDLHRNWTFENETWDNRKRAIDLANNKIRAEQEKIEVDTEYQKIINSFTPKEQKIILKNLAKEYDKIVSEINSNNASAARTIAEKMFIDMQKEGLEIDNMEKEQLIGATLNKAESEAEEAYWRSQREAKLVRFGRRGEEFLPDPRSAVSGSKRHTDFRRHGDRKHYKVIVRDGKREIVQF